MALTYPLSAPTGGRNVSGITISGRSVVGFQESPFTLEHAVYVHDGDGWKLEANLPPMRRPYADPWIAMLLGLNGMEGTFLLGDPAGKEPRGTWAGSPKVLGAVAARAKSIPMDGYNAGATVKAGDWFQSGTGASTHLHKVTKDATADGSGLLTLEIFPRLRAALADNDTFITTNTVGLWRLATPEQDWSIARAQIFGIKFAAIEVQ